VDRILSMVEMPVADQDRSRSYINEVFDDKQSMSRSQFEASNESVEEDDPARSREAAMVSGRRALAFSAAVR
jgi:hypothetical protein